MLYAWILVTISHGLPFPFIWTNLIMPLDWYYQIWQWLRLCNIWWSFAACITVELTTEQLSPNIHEASKPLNMWIGIPRYCILLRRSMIWLVQIQATAYLLPYVAFLKQDCSFKYHSIGVLFRIWMMSFCDIPVFILSIRLALENLEIGTDFHICVGHEWGRLSGSPAYTLFQFI